MTHRNITTKHVGLKVDSVIKFNHILCLVTHRLISIAQAIQLRKIKPNLLQFLSRNNDMREALYGLLFVNCFNSKTPIPKITLSKFSFSGINDTSIWSWQILSVPTAQ